MRRMCSTPVAGGGICLLVVQTSGKASTRCWMSLGMAERITLLREVEREPGKTVPLPRRTQAAKGSTVILNLRIKLMLRIGPST